MPDPISAIAGASLLGAGASVYGSSKAADAQKEAANQANATQLQMYNQQRADLAPYTEAGGEGLLGLQAVEKGSRGWEEQRRRIVAARAPRLMVSSQQLTDWCARGSGPQPAVPAVPSMGVPCPCPAPPLTCCPASSLPCPALPCPALPCPANCRPAATRPTSTCWYGGQWRAMPGRQTTSCRCTRWAWGRSEGDDARYARYWGLQGPEMG